MGESNLNGSLTVNEFSILYEQYANNKRGKIMNDNTVHQMYIGDAIECLPEMSIGKTNLIERVLTTLVETDLCEAEIIAFNIFFDRLMRTTKGAKQ